MTDEARLDLDEKELVHAVHQLLVERAPNGNAGLAVALGAVTNVATLLIADFPPEHRETIFEKFIKAIAADIQQGKEPLSPPTDYAHSSDTDEVFEPDPDLTHAILQLLVERALRAHKSAGDDWRVEVNIALDAMLYVIATLIVRCRPEHRRRQ